MYVWLYNLAFFLRLTRQTVRALVLQAHVLVDFIKWLKMKRCHIACSVRALYVHDGWCMPFVVNYWICHFVVHLIVIASCIYTCACANHVQILLIVQSHRYISLPSTFTAVHAYFVIRSTTQVCIVNYELVRVCTWLIRFVRSKHHIHVQIPVRIFKLFVLALWRWRSFLCTAQYTQHVHCMLCEECVHYVFRFFAK